MKKLIAYLLVLAMMVCLLAACGTDSASTDNAEQTTDAEQADEEENYDTGDASLDDPLNQDDIGESELLVVSFGTSFNDSRRETIGAIEKAMAEAFPDMSVRRGFTSQIIIDHVMDRDGEKIDNITEALDRAVANGVKTLVVQPTHLMPGFEYNDVLDEIASYSDAFENIVIGRPILDTEEDFQTVADIIVDATKDYDDGNTAIVFMGHGTEADSNGVYAQMQQLLTDMGMANYYIGTVEATPSVDDVLALVQAGDYSRVVLRPLMIVAGDHANNDMAGDEEDSWKSVFEGAGYEVVCDVHGLGELTGIQDLLVSHAQAAVDELDENYDTGDASLDDPLNQDDIGENELLVVSFGTSFNDSRRETIGGVEKALATAFPDLSVRRAFTSQIIIDHIQRRDDVKIDNVSEALERAVANGVKTLVVQPTHLMNGFEYTDLVDELAQYSDTFDKISIGEPLLTSDSDFEAVAKAIVQVTEEYDDGNTAIVFMGHGTEADSNGVYAKMQQLLTDKGYDNYYIGTVEATPSVDDVLALVQAGDYSRVVLRPLMIVAGDHANNDMAGDEADSWKTIFEGAGYEVVCVVEGLGGISAIQDLFVQHATAAVEAAAE